MRLCALEALILLAVLALVLSNLTEDRVWYTRRTLARSVLFYAINRYDALPALSVGNGCPPNDILAGPRPRHLGDQA